MIKELKLKNVGVHKKRTFNFTEGFNIIRGANEGGKSTVLEAIAICLFGASAIRGSWEDIVTEGEPVSSLKINLEFGPYKVHRSKSSASVTGNKVKISGHTNVTNFFLDHFGVKKGTEKFVMVAEQGAIQGILESGATDASKFIESLAGFYQIDELIEKVKAVYPVVDKASLEQQIEDLDIKRTEIEMEDLPDIKHLNLIQVECAIQRDTSIDQLDRAKDKVSRMGEILEGMKTKQRAYEAAVAGEVQARQVVTTLQNKMDEYEDSRVSVITWLKNSTEDLAAANIIQEKARSVALDKALYGRVMSIPSYEVTWDGDLESFQKEWNLFVVSGGLHKVELAGLEKDLRELEVAGPDLKEVEVLSELLVKTQGELQEVQSRSLVNTKPWKETLGDLTNARSEMKVLKSKLAKDMICPTCETDLTEKREAHNKKVQLEIGELQLSIDAFEERLDNLEQEFQLGIAREVVGLTSKTTDLEDSIDTIIEAQTLLHTNAVAEVQAKIKQISDQLKEVQENLEIFREIDNLQSRLDWVDDDRLTVNKSIIPWDISWKGSPPEDIDTTWAEDYLKEHAKKVNRKEFLTEELVVLNKEYGIAVEDLALAKTNLDKEEKQTGIQAAEMKVQESKEIQQEAEDLLSKVRDDLAQSDKALSIAETEVLNHNNRLIEVTKEITSVKEKLLKSAENRNLHLAVTKARNEVIDKVWNTLLSAADECFSGVRGKESNITRNGKTFMVDGMKTIRLSGSTLDALGLAMRSAIKNIFAPAADFMMLDELAAGMDDDRTAAAMAQVATLDVGQVLLCTHEDVSDTLADNIVEV